jgi:hypothetical protein
MSLDGVSSLRQQWQSKQADWTKWMLGKKAMLQQAMMSSDAVTLSL